MANQRQLLLLEEQTVLSRERTMQQYMSTGAAFIALGIVVTQLHVIPDVSANALLGLGLIGIGLWQVYQAYLRFKKYRNLARKIRKKEKKAGLEVGE